MPLRLGRYVLASPRSVSILVVMPVPPPNRPSRRFPVVLSSTALVSFISARKAAALAIAELGVAAFFVAGVTRSSLGDSAAWFVLLAVLLTAFVRAVDIESWAVLVPGGLRPPRLWTAWRQSCRRGGAGGTSAAGGARIGSRRTLRSRGGRDRDRRMASDGPRQARGPGRDARRGAHRASVDPRASRPRSWSPHDRARRLDRRWNSRADDDVGRGQPGARDAADRSPVRAAASR